MTYMRSSLSGLNAFAISRRLAAFFLLFSLFESAAKSQTLNATIFNSNYTNNSGQTLTLLNNGTSGVNGAYFTNYGTVQADGNFQVGTSDWGVFTQNAGTFNVNDYLSIARNSGSGSIYVYGGWVNAWNRPIIVGESGEGFIGINGGGVYAPNGTVLSGNAGSVGSLDLNSGILVTSQIYKWGAGTGNLTLSGGTLKATREEWNFISGLNSANIGSNGAEINNDGKGIGINQTLTGSGSGSVIFDGSNWTTLRQNNTYTGDTLVRGGVLQLYENGSLYNNGTAAGNIYVNSGATLYFNKQDVFGNADTGSSSPVRITLNGGTINNGGVFNNLANLTMNGGNLNASGGSAYGWNAYELNNVTVGGSSASTITSNTSVNGNNDILLSRAGTTTFNVGSTGDATGDLKVSAKLTDGNGRVGSLTKTGAGKMVLSAANTYTGETKVLAGTLVVNTGGSIASSSTIISSGATVQGSGSINNLLVSSNGLVKILSASTNSTGAWNTAGTINFNSGSKIDVTGLTLSQQPYVLIRGSSVTGTPTVQGATGFTVSRIGNMIGLTPTVDTDGDGLTNYQESQLGTNPNIVDTDSDSLLDGAEVALGTNPNNGDTDGDRVADGVEVNNGTDPLLASSNPLPVIVTQPVGGTKNVEESWSFTVVATDPTSSFLAYQWKKNGVNFRENSFDPTLSFASLQISDAGSYEVLISNPLGNTTSSVATLVVNLSADTTAPVVTLNGANPLQIYKGATFSDPGATVTDNVDATRTITGSGTVNTASVGNYTRTYNATDAAGNLALPVTRTVSVVLDPTIDTDGDGLTDVQEAALRTNPLLADTDGDGASDKLEVDLGNSPTVVNVYNRLINGSFEDGTVKPSSNNWRAVPQNDVPGWRTTANNEYTIELWYSGFLGSSGNVGNTLAELNYIANGTLYQDVTMTVNSPVSYSFLHRGREGNDVMDFKIDELSGGPGTSVVNNKFTRRVTTGTSWVRYSGSQATEVEAGKTYRFSYTSISPTGGNGNLLDDASFGIDQDGDSLLDYEEITLGTDPLDFDSDNDGLKDGEEVVTYGTNPLLVDTDSDGAPDGVEVTAGTNPSQESSLPKPGITLQPVSITRTSGEGVTFSVTATNPAGSPSALTYQWYKNGTAIPTGTNPTLIILPLTIAEAGNYSVVVSNLYGAVTSNIASLTVNKATPIITTAPTATPIAYGQTLAFSTLSGGVASVAGSFVWTTPSTLPSAGTVSQSVTFNPTDTANYNTATASVNVTVNEALISSGFSHTLYLGAGASTVTAWGMNTDGRLGVGDMNSPVNWAKAVQGIPLGYTVTGLAAGGTHSLILANGKVYAAGSDRFGQLGQGGTSRINQSSFIQVFAPTSRVVAVSAGGNHSLAVTESGKVFACGDNFYGQLAQPATTSSSVTFIEVLFPALTNRIVSVAAGADHNLAVDEGGGVWVWGRNNYGQLGKGSPSVSERTPLKLNLGDVVAESVAAGFSHSLILRTDGKVLGFGRNNSGQTGQSATSSVVLVPTLISGLSEIRLISAGTDSSFAIAESGRLYSWGYNSYGELLLGYSSPSSSPAVYGPRPSPIATNVFNVSGGGYSSLAVGAQGVIFGGRNDVGQAGNGPDPDEVVGDYYYGAGNLALTNLTMDLAGTAETLYDQIFVGNGAATLNGILNLMFVGTYTGPVYGSTQTFDLIWAKNGIVLGAGYQLAFNQAGYLVESAVADKIVEGVSGKVLQATVRAVVTAADLAKAVQTANPVLHQVQSVSYKSTGLSSLSLGSEMEMIYSYERPTGGVMSGAEYFVGGATYRVEYSPYLNSIWNSAQVTGTTVTPLGGGYERATLRISASGSTGFLRLEIVVPPET
jgi:autotransporter-associated beta strand protein